MSPVRRLDIVTQKDFNSAKFAVDFLEYNPDSLNQDDGLEDFIKPEFAKALSVSTSRLNIYSILTVQRRLQTENTEDENDLDLSDMSNKAVIIELANDKYSDMVSPVEAALALTLIDLNQFLSRFELTAINISNRFEMTNQQPEWVKAANVWSVSGTSITVAG